MSPGVAASPSALPMVTPPAFEPAPPARLSSLSLPRALRAFQMIRNTSGIVPVRPFFKLLTANTHSKRIAAARKIEPTASAIAIISIFDTFSRDTLLTGSRTINPDFNFGTAPAEITVFGAWGADVVRHHYTNTPGRNTAQLALAARALLVSAVYSALQHPRNQNSEHAVNTVLQGLNEFADGHNGLPGRFIARSLRTYASAGTSTLDGAPLLCCDTRRYIDFAARKLNDLGKKAVPVMIKYLRDPKTTELQRVVLTQALASRRDNAAEDFIKGLLSKTPDHQSREERLTYEVALRAIAENPPRYVDTLDKIMNKQRGESLYELPFSMIAAVALYKSEILACKNPAGKSLRKEISRRLNMHNPQDLLTNRAFVRELSSIGKPLIELLEPMLTIGPDSFRADSRLTAALLILCQDPTHNKAKAQVMKTFHKLVQYSEAEQDWDKALDLLMTLRDVLGDSGYGFYIDLMDKYERTPLGDEALALYRRHSPPAFSWTPSRMGVNFL